MPEERGLARLSTGLPVVSLTVSQLTRSVRDALEHRFPLLWVRGEISNCVVARSGHVYFALKDSQSQVRCVMFRNRVDAVGWHPRDGDEIEVQGLVTLYEARGDFQLVIENMRKGGRGALFEAFLRMRDKLEREGLFDAGRKRPLPTLPRTIGVVTSLQAAALHDVLSTLERRNPSINVIVYPAPVQGDGAGASIARVLAIAAKRQECDALILCRGGGSIEDLWPFNDEAVARAVRACPMPVVSGVGHETDFTIADFAADQRAPTPTAAAELLSPRRSELLGGLEGLTHRLIRACQRDLQTLGQWVDQLSRRIEHPARRLEHQTAVLAALRTRVLVAGARSLEHCQGKVSRLLQRSRDLAPDTLAWEYRVQQLAHRLLSAHVTRVGHQTMALQSLVSSLAHLSPDRVLERGYSMTLDEHGQVINDAASLLPGARVSLRFARGGATARIESSARSEEHTSELQSH